MKKIKGLTQKEVEEKIKQGKINKIKIKTNESFSKIICKNIFTYFNFIFFINYFFIYFLVSSNTDLIIITPLKKPRLKYSNVIYIYYFYNYFNK